MFGYIKRLPDNVRKGVYITELVLSLLATIVGILIFVGVDVPTILGIFNLVVAFILMIGGAFNVLFDIVKKVIKMIWGVSSNAHFIWATIFVHLMIFVFRLGIIWVIIAFTIMIVFFISFLPTLATLLKVHLDPTY